MEIARIPNSVWSDLIKGRISCRIEFLGLKFLLIKLKMQVDSVDNQDTLNKAINELKDYLLKIENNPILKNDLEKICKTGSMV